MVCTWVEDNKNLYQLWSWYFLKITECLAQFFHSDWATGKTRTHRHLLQASKTLPSQFILDKRKQNIFQHSFFICSRSLSRDLFFYVCKQENAPGNTGPVLWDFSLQTHQSGLVTLAIYCLDFFKVVNELNSIRYPNYGRHNLVGAVHSCDCWFVTMDEIWIHHYTPEPNQKSAEWIASGESRPKQPINATISWQGYDVLLGI